MIKLEFDLAKKALIKGAKALIIKTEYGWYVEIKAFGRVLGKFQFDNEKQLVDSFVIESDFYPLELAKYELSKKRVKRKYRRKYGS